MKRSVMLAGLLLVVALLVSVSCTPAFMESEEEAVRVERASTAPSSAPAPPPTIITTKEMRFDTNQQLAAERMIVRTGDVALVVEDVPVAIDRITKMADGLEGYVVSSNVWKENERGRLAVLPFG